MVDLVLRPSGLADPKRAMSLQLRYHDMAETNYATIARVSVDVAREIIAAGAAYYLFGEPKEDAAPDGAPEFAESYRINRVAALLAERADLKAANDKAEAWGAAVAARNERLIEVENELRGLQAEGETP